MPELETAKSDHESSHGPQGSHGGGAADPPSGMGEWWKTPPSLVGPPAVDPAIYGIEPSDVGVDHAGGLDAYIGMSGAASAQAGPGGADPARVTHTQQADAGRGHAMGAQLMLAARNIYVIIDKVDAAINAGVADRSPDGVVEQIGQLIQEAKDERGKIALVTKEKFAHPSLRDGLKHVSRASYDLDHAILRAKAFASRNKVADPKIVGALDYEDVKNDVNRLEGVLHMKEDTSGVKRVTEAEKDLQVYSLDESLDGLHHSTQALVLAMGESDPRKAMSEVLPGLTSSVRMLKVSLVKGMKPSSGMLAKGKRIIGNMTKALRDAAGVKIVDTALTQAGAAVEEVIDDLEKLAKAKHK